MVTTSTNNPDQKINHRAVNLFLVLFLIIGGTIGGIVAIIYRSEIHSFQTRIKAREANFISLQSRAIGKTFDGIVNDLLFLSRQNELVQLLTTGDKKWAFAMQREYLELAKRKKVYDQIRYLDKTGSEKIRVNYNRGHPKAVVSAQLQDKSRRYYFRDAFVLEEGEVFISPLDLNIENKKIEMPLKPMIRFGTPVFDNQGKKRGIVLINYLAGSLLEVIGSAGEVFQGAPMLINKDGYWLFSPVQEDQWGFMIPERKERNMAQRYPEEWADMLSRKAGQFQTDNGLFTFTTVYPLQEGFRTSTGSDRPYAPSIKELDPSQYFWVLLSHIPHGEIRSHQNQLMVRYFLMGAGLFVFIALAAWFMALAITRRRLYQAKLLSMAMYDTLTGIPNRRLFFDRLIAGSDHANRFTRHLGLLYIDLDGFKAVNDTRGHDAGDELLVKVAEILRRSSRKSDTVARLGGDEFAIILFEIRSAESAVQAGEKIIRALSAPITLSGGAVTIGASIGVAVYPDHATDAEALLKLADQAMYQSKAKGKNTCTAAAIHETE